jgi:hypothetical protein
LDCLTNGLKSTARYFARVMSERLCISLPVLTVFLPYVHRRTEARDVILLSSSSSGTSASLTSQNVLLSVLTCSIFRALIWSKIYK